MLQSQSRDTLAKVAWVLGLGGLIPFVWHVAAMWWFSAPPAPLILASSQTLYAAIIMSFLGALHWGIALADPLRFGRGLVPMMVWSVLPPIYAWIVAQLTQHRALILLSVGLVVIFLVDWQLYRRHEDLRWFVRLRLVLTAVATASLLATLMLLSR